MPTQKPDESPVAKTSTMPSKPVDQPMLDLYADYLISSLSYTTATGLSKALDGVASHDG